MLTAVCLNPCIDKTVEIDAFTYGGMNRIRASRADGSGKGVNVALAARTLGLEAACIGFCYPVGAESIKQRLREAGAGFSFIEGEGAVRVNLKVLDRATGRITEINEGGQTVTADQLAKMEALVEDYARRSDVMVFTGSLPPGVPEDFYATLLRIAAPHCKTVLDAEGKKLALGLAEKPALIKPNTYELELLTGRSLPTLKDIKEAAIDCVKQGAAVVAVSMGGDGALLTDGRETYYAPCLKVDVRSTVGAGDSMVAGFLKGMSEGCDLSTLLRYGAAAGTAGVMTEGTLLLRGEDFEALLPRVTIQSV